MKESLFEDIRLRNEQKIPVEAFFHYDTPCTIVNQTAMLNCAGFGSIENVFRVGGTLTILVEKKEMS